MAKLISPNGSISMGMNIGAAVGRALEEVGVNPGLLQRTYENVVRNGGTATINGPGGVAQVIPETKDMQHMFKNSASVATAPSVEVSEPTAKVVDTLPIMIFKIVLLMIVQLFMLAIVSVELPTFAGLMLLLSPVTSCLIARYII